MRRLGVLYRSSRSFARLKRHAAACLALLAILIHTATPALAQIAASANGGTATIICSGDEARTVYIDADGELTHAPATPDQREHCAACIHHMPIVPPIAAEPAPRVVIAYQALPVSLNIDAASYPTGLPPRAPPAS